MTVKNPKMKMKMIGSCVVFVLLAWSATAQGRFQHSVGITYLNTHTQQQRFIYEPFQRPSYEVLTPKYYKEFVTLFYHTRINVQQWEQTGLSIAIPLGISAFAEISNTPDFLRDRNNYILLHLPVVGEYAWGYCAYRGKDDAIVGLFAQVGGAMLFARGTVGDFTTFSPYVGGGIRLKLTERIGLELSYGQNFIGIRELPPYSGFVESLPPDFSELGVRYPDEKDRRQSHAFQLGIILR